MSCYTPEFIADRIEHYTSRMANTRTIKERAFVRGELHRFRRLQTASNPSFKNHTIHLTEKPAMM